MENYKKHITYDYEFKRGSVTGLKYLSITFYFKRLPIYYCAFRPCEVEWEYRKSFYNGHNFNYVDGLVYETQLDSWAIEISETITCENENI